MNTAIAFLTGLTAGGLGCLAVQGGLLASSLACQVDLDLQAQGRNRATDSRNTASFHIAGPIALFLLAKLVVYSALGFLLGACGSLLQITPRTRAALIIFIGLFMVGNGLRLSNVHPVFRRFVIEPPAAISNFIRRTSRNGTLVIAPLFLGSLTVLLPCGVTQAMMAAALATGRPLQGAALLFAFILGTCPLFFAVTYSTFRLGAAMERQLRRMVAAILIALGAVSCVHGLNLAGLPVSVPWRSSVLSAALGAGHRRHPPCLRGPCHERRLQPGRAAPSRGPGRHPRLGHPRSLVLRRIRGHPRLILRGSAAIDRPDPAGHPGAEEGHHSELLLLHGASLRPACVRRRMKSAMRARQGRIR